jgi:hypothetical protein
MPNLAREKIKKRRITGSTAANNALSMHLIAARVSPEGTTSVLHVGLA